MRVLDYRPSKKISKWNDNLHIAELLIDTNKWVECEALTLEISNKNNHVYQLYFTTRVVNCKDERLLEILADIYTDHMKAKLTNAIEPLYKVIFKLSKDNKWEYKIVIDDYLLRENRISTFKVKEYVNNVRIGSLIGTTRNTIIFDEIILPKGIGLSIGKDAHEIRTYDQYYIINTYNLVNLEDVSSLTGDLGDLRLYRNNKETLSKHLWFNNITGKFDISDFELVSLVIQGKPTKLNLTGLYSLEKLVIPDISEKSKFYGILNTVEVYTSGSVDKIKIDGQYVEVKPFNI